ncbi:SRPBCC family protein [Edaphobacter dinghuensis]|uniref:Ligand-binding SRPBCC domain-containing protein n=1 Tax=Edaphobacter dinghuensis TaxID=1560005 RepID=A0A917M4F1_9BACT|nr:SRPBCC family protein [Edaphobacter dinghuensis]GGG77091.1 hypothetical protein GCM10011585_20160 [Edaphobacter dinghuensis]
MAAMHTFHSRQWLALPTELVFAFFANPANLPLLMPDWQQARIEEASIVAPPISPHAISTPVAGAGTRLTLSFRPFPFSPVRLQWQAEIDSFVWNSHFSDKQLRGPFDYWHHTHKVTHETRNSEDGTLLEDEIQYRLPFGRFGNLASPLIAMQLRQTFDYRHRRTLELLA